MRRFWILLLFVCVFVSCGDKKQEWKQTIYKEITDTYGRKIVLTKKPERIISISPGITENIFALGEGGRLVGRSAYCLYPKEVEKIPDVGDMLQINTEKIISLQPDLIIIGSIISKDKVQFFSQMGIPVVAIKESSNFAGIYDNLKLLGFVLDKEAKAEEIISELKTGVKELQAKAKAKDTARKPTVYYVVGYGQGGEFTAGGNTYINDLIELSGGKNIAKDVTGWAFSRELLFERNPEYIFIRKEDFENFCKTAPYNTLQAVKEGRAFPIESSWVDVQTPRSIEALRFISQKISAK